MHTEWITGRVKRRGISYFSPSSSLFSIFSHIFPHFSLSSHLIFSLMHFFYYFTPLLFDTPFHPLTFHITVSHPLPLLPRLQSSLLFFSLSFPLPYSFIHTLTLNSVYITLSLHPSISFVITLLFQVLIHRFTIYFSLPHSHPHPVLLTTHFLFTFPLSLRLTHSHTFSSPPPTSFFASGAQKVTYLSQHPQD